MDRQRLGIRLLPLFTVAFDDDNLWARVTWKLSDVRLACLPHLDAGGRQGAVNEKITRQKRWSGKAVCG